MIKKALNLMSALVLLTPADLRSQVIPAEGSTLNYRLAGFSFPAQKSTGNYVIEIAMGSFYNEDSFKTHVIKKAPCTKNRIVTEVPAFGSYYTWRYVQAGSVAGSSSRLYHFSTLASPVADTSLYRLHVTTKAKTYKDAYVFVDANKTMYDMEGRPVWFLPLIEGKNLDPRDLKLTPGGTITFVSDNNAYEISYSGDVRWKAPNGLTAEGEQLEHYHHEVTRLKNGHYMVLGSEPILIERHSSGDTDLHYVAFDKTLLSPGQMIYQPAMLCKVMEYDKRGQLMWSWRGSDYFKGSIARYYKNLEELRGGAELDFHQNAFYFDEKERNVYVS